MNSEKTKTMDKPKEANLDELAVGVLRCVRRLLELLERCVRTDAMQTKDTATNTTGNETDSTGKGDQNESNTEENAAEKIGVESELRDVLQVMVGTLRRIVDDLKKEDKEKTSPLPSLFDISITPSEKTLSTSENTPGDANEENVRNNNNKNVNEEYVKDKDSAEGEQQTTDASEHESIDQDEGIGEEKEELVIPETNIDGVSSQIENNDNYEGNSETWNEIPNDKKAEERHMEDEEEEVDQPPVDENSVAEAGEETQPEAVLEGEGGDTIELEEEEDDSGEAADGEPQSKEGSGDHHPLIEEIDPPETEEQLDESLLLDIEAEEAASFSADPQAVAVDLESDNWEPECCDRTQSVTAVAADDTNLTEDDDAADECGQKDDLEPSDMEYDSFFPTEDEDVLPVAESTSDEDAPEVLGLSAVRMFRKHMELDNVEVEMFPTPRAQPRRHFFYTCRVLGLEAEACGRSKRAAKRNAVSKIIRLIIKKQKDGSLPPEVTPFTAEELASLAEACRGGADYLSRLRQLCRALHAPPPTYDVQSSLEAGGNKVFTVQCSALGRTAVGICAKKRSAKRHAAREIVKRYEEEAAAAGAPVTPSALTL
ncbi:uncharacterized protein LOC126341588 [Schistocerca gregaria]|uniref:uncharacterized protein LOC126341588 n=1 Tax=Schistocerca gregaria TaxID=7010 RepID=UPI00211E3C50|nr:uncharacterized protein LOC126341588 [Schistocerca gregaria]